jgi:hypothetical protein
MTPDDEENTAFKRVDVVKVIGTLTRYRGAERRYLHGHLVEIVAVLKNALTRSKQQPVVVTDEELAAAGGVTTLDRVVVAVPGAPGEEDRMGGAVKAVDLECFRQVLQRRGTT